MGRLTERRRAIPGLLVAGASLAAAAARAETNPFATHELVLQLSDGSAEKASLVISVANSVLDDYPNRVAIVVVAFGPGVPLLYAGSPERVAVESLVVQGVEFDICMNTIKTIVRETGHLPDLNQHAVPVPFGVPRIMELVGKGYVLVRP